jgi:hypothetical protein
MIFIATLNPKPCLLYIVESPGSKALLHLPTSRCNALHSQGFSLSSNEAGQSILTSKRIAHWTSGITCCGFEKT